MIENAYLIETNGDRMIAVQTDGGKWYSSNAADDRAVTEILYKRQDGEVWPIKMCRPYTQVQNYAWASEEEWAQRNGGYAYCPGCNGMDIEEFADGCEYVELPGSGCYEVDYGTGAGNDYDIPTLDEAIETARQGAAYTQCGITIRDHRGDEVRYFPWCGYPADEDAEVFVDFGDFGFFGMPCDD